jgi:hypothetical protein
MQEQQKPLKADHRGYWGYRELTEEELKHVGGSGCGCGCGCGGGADDGGDTNGDTNTDYGTDMDELGKAWEAAVAESANQGALSAAESALAAAQAAQAEAEKAAQAAKEALDQHNQYMQDTYGTTYPQADWQ